MKSSTYLSAAQLSKGQFRSIAFNEMYKARVAEEMEDEANTAINEWGETNNEALTELASLLTTVKIVDTFHQDEATITDETLGTITYSAEKTEDGYVIGMLLPIVNWKEVANVVITPTLFGIRTANEKVQPTSYGIRPHFSRLVAKKLAALFERKEQDFI